MEVLPNGNGKRHLHILQRFFCFSAHMKRYFGQFARGLCVLKAARWRNISGEETGCNGNWPVTTSEWMFLGGIVSFYRTFWEETLSCFLDFPCRITITALFKQRNAAFAAKHMARICLPPWWKCRELSATIREEIKREIEHVCFHSWPDFQGLIPEKKIHA